MSKKSIDTKLARRVQEATGCKYMVAFNLITKKLAEDDESQPWALFKEQAVAEAIKELKKP